MLQLSIRTQFSHSLGCYFFDSRVQHVVLEVIAYLKLVIIYIFS